MRQTMRAIESIVVKRLFDTNDYQLQTKSRESNTDKIMILYGDNGSGKTTILKCLFHLLAPEDGEGHKSQVAAIPFHRFEVVFNTGDRVWAQRPESRPSGSFTMGVQIGRKKEAAVEFIADKNNIVKATSDKHNAQIKKFLGALRELSVSLYLLSDDRTVQLAGRDKRSGSIQPDMELISEEDIVFYHDAPRGMSPTLRRPIDLEKMAQNLLAQSLKRAEAWIQTQVLHSSSIGESSVNSLYNEILKRLTTLQIGETLQLDDNKRSIEERVRQLENRSRKYSKYGLLPEFNGKDIAKAISTARADSISIMSNVLSPYLDSVEKKLDAMEKINRQIDTFVRVINSFFMQKSIVYKMHAGFEVQSESGKLLQPHMLSSGERHLLLLFCNTLVALDRASIFIIDEPEISLNIKWQRRLLTSLLECVGENPVQYIFATHSMELLAQHKSNVLKLA
jgi:energy-coupling factor transporter ATP-binding protein EcfA2